MFGRIDNMSESATQVKLIRTRIAYVAWFYTVKNSLFDRKMQKGHFADPQP